MTSFVPVTADDTTTTHPALKPYADRLMYRSVIAGRPAEDWTFGELATSFPLFNIGTLLSGLNRLAELEAGAPGSTWHRIYDDADCTDDPEKKDVGYWFFPARPERIAERGTQSAPFVIAVAGGAYTSVCTMAESMPVAAKLNDLGYDVFIPNYRVGVFGDTVVPAMPKPLDDMAAVWRHIDARRAEYGLGTRGYVVTGFSAAGNLTMEWGSKAVGYAHYGIPAPVALFPIYGLPVLDAGDEGGFFRTITLGTNASDELAERYDVLKQMDGNYPPCYVVHGKRDSICPVVHSLRFKEALDANGVTSRLEIAETADHGFGDGQSTDAEGWPVRAVHFLERLI